MTDASPDPGAAAVGARVRSLREVRALSLSALARAAGIGKASLSELEQGRRNPTLATLYALAGPLGVPLVDLLGEAPGVTTDDGALTARLLHAERSDDDVTEVYWISLPPGAERSSPAHAAGAREHVLVTRGSLTVTVDGPGGGTTTRLAVGESHAWAADVAHIYTAGPEGAAAVNTIRSRPPVV